MQSLLKIPTSFLKINNKIIKIHLEPKRTPNSQIRLREKKSRDVLSDFKIRYKMPIIKTVWHQHQSRLRDQRHKIGDLGIIPPTHGWLVFQGGRDCTMRKVWSLQQSVVVKLGLRKKQHAPLCYTVHRNQLKLIKDLNVKT